jgi:uncharacterized protein YkwD
MLSPPARLLSLLVLTAAFVAAAGAQADAVSAIQVLRAGGCGGILPAAEPLRPNALLDRAAVQWAAGRPVTEATERNGYRAAAAATVHVSGPDNALLELIRRSDCPLVMNRDLREVGVYRRGLDSWLVLATAEPAPSGARLPDRTSAAPLPDVAAAAVRAPLTRTSPAASLREASVQALATRALQLVNEARAHGTRCGRRTFAPAPPVTLSETLAGVAFGHALDMAEHNYFEHEDLIGQSPADRVRAVGYREKLVGENIAYGPPSVEEAVQGWLDSPDHCENIMDPRFAQMGIASATGHAPSRHGLYWVQVLAEPRA